MGYNIKHIPMVTSACIFLLSILREQISPSVAKHRTNFLACHPGGMGKYYRHLYPKYHSTHNKCKKGIKLPTLTHSRVLPTVKANRLMPFNHKVVRTRTRIMSARQRRRTKRLRRCNPSVTRGTDGFLQSIPGWVVPGQV